MPFWFSSFHRNTWVLIALNQHKENRSRLSAAGVVRYTVGAIACGPGVRAASPSQPQCQMRPGWSFPKCRDAPTASRQKKPFYDYPDISIAPCSLRIFRQGDGVGTAVKAPAELCVSVSPKVTSWNENPEAGVLSDGPFGRQSPCGCYHALWKRRTECLGPLCSTSHSWGPSSALLSPVRRQPHRTPVLGFSLHVSNHLWPL